MGVVAIGCLVLDVDDSDRVGRPGTLPPTRNAHDWVADAKKAFLTAKVDAELWRNRKQSLIWHQTKFNFGSWGQRALMTPIKATRVGASIY